MSDAGTLFQLDSTYVFTFREGESITGRVLSATSFNEDTIITLEANDGIHRVKFATIDRWRQLDEV